MAKTPRKLRKHYAATPDVGRAMLRERVAADVAAFLAGGGKVERIPPGETVDRRRTQPIAHVSETPARPVWRHEEGLL